MRRWRRGLGAAGGLLLAYGALRLVTQNSVADLLAIALWLVAAVALHDGVLAPGVVGVGRLLTHLPARARRWVQIGLVVGALLTAVAVPLIHRQGSQPESKALLVRDYSANLALLLGLVGVVSVAGHLTRSVARPLPQRDG